jgi:hypothetical protein
MAASPEEPLYVEYLQHNGVYSYASQFTPTERRPLVNNEVFVEFLSIPASPPLRTAYPGTVSGVVAGISGVTLSAVPGSSTQFYSAQFVDMVPAVLYDYAYTPTLVDSKGVSITYDPSVWVADGVLNIVEFKYGVPAGLKPPFTISYWRYIGAFPTVNGVTAISNAGGGAGEIFSALSSGAVALRTIAPSAVGGEDGISVATSGQLVTIGNTLSGLSIGTGAEVFKAKTGAALEFRSIIAGPGIVVNQNADDISIEASGIMLSFANVGGGAGAVYETI